MTEQSSCKSFFKEYLVYRLSAQKANLILCCILNILTLPLFFTAIMAGYGNMNSSEFYYFGSYFAILCGIFLIVLAVIGAVTSFEYYNSKKLTDMIGSLPLSYKQRFWGDFIAGYIANAAPVIPIGLITAFFFGTYSGFRDPGIFGKLPFMIGMALSLIMALTFVYLFAVLIVSACGKVLHSVLFSIFGTASLTGTAVGLAGCFASGMLGVDTLEYMYETVRFFPPLGPVIDLLHGISYLRGNSFVLSFKNAYFYLDYDSIGDFFAVMNVWQLLYFVLLGTCIALGAFYLGKKRKTEKTGSAFAVKPVFYVIGSLISASAVLMMTVMSVGSSDLRSRLLLAAGAGGIMFITAAVIYFPKKKNLPQCVLCGMLSIGVSVGTAALLRGTRSFGLAYLPDNTKEIKYIRVNYSFDITDKSDIREYIKTHNNILRSRWEDIEFGSSGYSHSVEIMTVDGRITYRQYYSPSRNAILEMENNVKSLEGYGRYFFEDLSHYSSRFECRVIEERVTYDIPEQDAEEFLAVLSAEAAEKYDPQAELYASVEFGHSHSQSFNIQKNFENTIALLKRIRSTAEIDPDQIILSIKYRAGGTSADNQAMSIAVRNKDMDDPLVKELIGLLEEANSGGSVSDYSFSVYYETVGSSSGYEYFVPKNNSKRVLEIMADLALKEQESLSS